MLQDGQLKTISSGAGTIPPRSRAPRWARGRRSAPRAPCEAPRTGPDRPDNTGRRPPKRGRRNMSTGHTGFKLFPFSNFRYFLTLFSKFFASFPHGTCSLSVSCRYLALDGIYHPLRAAVPSNSTLRKPTVRTRTPDHERVCHPPWRPFSNGLGSGPRLVRLL